MHRPIELGFCSSCIEINLGAIAHNLREIRQKIDQGVKVLAVVKSDAYGHGAQEVCLLLERCGVEMLGVTSVEEGVNLRLKGVGLPILVMGCIFPEEVGEFFSYSLTPNLCDLNLARKFSRYSIKLGQAIKVHIKIDTGMGGLGVRAQEASAFVREAAGLPGLLLEGLFTHFCSATEGGCTNEQLGRFRKVMEELESVGIHVPIKHTANSAAILNVPESYMPNGTTAFNMVRTGLLLYGLTPPGCPESSLKLKPAMTFKTRLAYIKTLEPGETVSYGRTYTAKSPTRIGVLPVGYNNGYNLRLSNKGYVVIRGKRFPVVGRVRMNLIHIDLGQEEQVEIGDIVTLYGEGGPSVEEVARLIEGSPYEVLCTTGKSNHRIYLDGIGQEEEHPHSTGEEQLAPLFATAH